jgi:hypothetical protein
VERKVALKLQNILNMKNCINIIKQTTDEGRRQTLIAVGQKY